MKNNILKLALALIMLLNLNATYAQAERLIPPDINGGECGTSAEGPVFRFNSSQLNQARFAVNLEKYVFNVKVHYIANNIPTNEQELKALDLVGALNLYFNQANIYFKYQGYDNISDALYLDITSSNIGTLYPANTNNIEIYICDFISGGTGTAGITYSWAIGNTISRKVIALRKEFMPVFSSPTPTLSDFKNFTAIHEVGHYLGLYHTHQQWKYNSSGVLVPEIDGSVTNIVCGIEENLDNSQSSTFGDLIPDTNPDRIQYKYWGTSAAYYSNCTIYTPGYQPNAVCGTSINLTQFNPPMNNIMAYYHQCRTGFSQGQQNYMRAFIDANTDGGFLTNQLNPNGIACLYEPYAQIPTIGDIVSITDDGISNGMSIVCRYLSGYTYKYQKGFNYIFNTYGDVTNHAVNEIPSYPDYGTFVISQLNTTYEHPFGFVCYRGAKVCQLEAMEGGKIYTTSNLGSNVFTETNLTPQDLENPNLINNLPNQTYNIIVKETVTGETKTETIYKGN